MDNFSDNTWYHKRICPPARKGGDRKSHANAGFHGQINNKIGEGPLPFLITGG
jgi:hypothetical protein